MTDHRDDSGRISRRAVLRGAGAAMALPWLEAMLPRAGSTASAAEAARIGSSGVAGAPKRMAFLYVPNGIHMQDWTPKAEGAGFEFTRTLEPLKPFKDKTLILTGLTADKARANGDGGGDHARASSAFLTGCQPRKTDGANIRAGVSIDQYVAQRIGDQTRIPSLEIGCEGGRMAGNCDSGYSCAYNSTISWRSESTPVPKETSAKAVFDRLFGNGAPDAYRAKLNRRRSAVLDLVMEDARNLRGSLGSTDQRKLDEYLSSVREVEQRIERQQKMPPLKPPPGTVAPPESTRDYGEHIRLMADLLVLAFQTDATRISTFVLANEGSNRSYASIGVPEGHHDLSHHGNDAAKQAKIQKINLFHMQQFAYLIGKLDAVKEADGRTLLDNSMIIYGSGNSDGNRHNHDDLPILLLGRGGGTVKTGRHVRYAKETPLNNLWMSMMDRVGVKTAKFGDGTARLTGLEG